MTGSGADIKELTDNGLTEAAGLISRREYNLSIVRSRQTAEMLIKSYAAEKNIEYTTLADTIEKLFQEGVINRTSRDAFHNIRLYGNKAVHEKDDDPEDAQKAYYLLKNEVRTFNSRKTVSVDRTPVRVESASSSRGSAGRSAAGATGTGSNSGAGFGSGAGYGSGNDGSGTASSQRSASGARRRGTSGTGRSSDGTGSSSGRSAAGTGAAGRGSSSQGSGRRSGRSGSSSGSARRGSSGSRQRQSESAAGGISIYDILRILIPVIAVILLIIIIRSLLPSKKTETATTTTPAVETTAEVAETEAPETEAPETEAPTQAASTEYRIKGSVVNIRYADDQNRIYTQLSNGTVIGPVTEIAGSDFVQFTLDGRAVVVNKNYIEPVS